MTALDQAPPLTGKPPPGSRLPYPLQTYLFAKHGARWLPALRRRYGDVFVIRLAPKGRRVVIIGRPELIKRVFSGSTSLFHAGGGNEILRPVMGDHSVLLLDEAEHLRVRQLLMPAFHGAPLRGYQDMITQLTVAEVESWPTGTPFRTHDRMTKLTLEIILQVVFGVTDETRLAQLRPVVDRIVNVDFVIMLGALYPLLGKLPPWSRFLRIQGDLDRLLYAEIADRRRQPDLAERTDVLSRLLAVDTDQPLTDAELRDNLITLLLAGHETTATALAWAFHELGRDRAQLAAAQRAADHDDQDYLEAVTKETLRRRPVIAAVARQLQQPIELGGYLLPKGANVNPAIALVQSDANLWDAPERFDASRFIGTQPAANTWIPFGGGVRRCLGASFSLLESGVILREVLRRYDVRADQPAPEPAARRNITLTPGRGGSVILTRR
jgi:cytochrome P450 family 135